MFAALMCAVLVCAAGLAAEDDGLAGALLRAGSAESSAELLRGRSPQELQTAMEQVAKTAGDRAAAHDCAMAVSDYEIAVAIARQAGTLTKAAQYFRRIGLCHVEQARNDLALAAYREGIAAAEQTDLTEISNAEILAENLHGAAVQLGRFGRYKEELPLSIRENELTDRCGHPDHQLRALLTYGSVTSQLGLFRQALISGERAVEVSRRSNLPGAFEFAAGNLAQYYAALGDGESGLRLLATLPDPNAINLDFMGAMEKDLHHYARAERDFQAGLAKASTAAEWRTRETLLLHLAELQQETREFSKARSSFNEVLSLSLAHQDPHIGGAAAAGLSELDSDEKNLDGAMRDADEALRLTREADSPEALGIALRAQGRSLELTGHDEEARQAFAEAISIAEALRVDAPATAAGLQGELGQWLPAYQAAIKHELHAGHAMEALRLADRAKARVLLDMLGGGESGFEAFADPKEQAEEKTAHALVASTRHAAITKADAISKNALETALRGAEDVDLRLYARHPELVLQRAPAPDISPDQLAALAGGRTALLSYFVTPDAVVLFVVRAGDKGGMPTVRMFSLEGGDKLDARIRSFRNQIAARDIDYRVSARELYDTLIGPAAAALRGTERWIVSPDGSLWDIPFQALVDTSGRHVIETHALTYAPSLSTLWQLRQKRPAAGELKIPLLAVANPAVKGVAPIPAAERESRAIMALYQKPGSLLLTGDRARPGSFRENAGSAEVIHIASHAEIETNHPLESFLLLTPDTKNDGNDDGAVTVRDILGMRLSASLVVLSACETARGKIGQGEGVLGLGWAVLAAGARASVVSQWKVDSDATSDLMIGFHQRLTGRHPVDKAEALRQASLAMMRSPGRQHPFYWASFMVIGDAR